MKPIEIKEIFSEEKLEKKFILEDGFIEEE